MGRSPSFCGQCRRVGEKLFLKGERCNTGKCSVQRRNYPKGQHGQAGSRLSEYGRRLREKQKAKAIYGLNEKQFRGYYEKANKSIDETGKKLLEFLERRLDNVVFRLGLAKSRQEARQLVRNGAIRVNNRKVNIPSYIVKANETIEIKPKFVDALREKIKDYAPPSWLALDDALKGTVVHMPTREDTDKLIQESLIVEYYSR